MKINLNGLRPILKKYDVEPNRCAQGKHWSIATGGYDCWWEIYYDGTPVAQCVSGQLQNECLEDEDFEKLKAIVEEEYPDLEDYKDPPEPEPEESKPETIKQSLEFVQ